MKPNIVFLKGTERSFNQEERNTIGIILRQTVPMAMQLLAIKGVINFVAYPHETSIMVDDPSWIGGCAYKANWVNLDFPPAPLNREALRQTSYHELHHLARGYFIQGSSCSLIDAVCAEGLATVFEIQQVPNKSVRHGQYSEEFVRIWLPRLKSEMWSLKYDHNAWFFGQNQEEERWVGYRLGTWLVHQIMERHPDRNPINLVHTLTTELVELSGVAS